MLYFPTIISSLKKCIGTKERNLESFAIHRFQHFLSEWCVKLKECTKMMETVSLDREMFNIYAKQNGLNQFTLKQTALKFIESNKTLEFISSFEHKNEFH